MVKRRIRNYGSTSLRLKTALDRKVVAAISLLAIIITALFFTYSTFFTPVASKAGEKLDIQNLKTEPAVHLAYFKAISTSSNTVLLEWSAYSEIGKDYYSIDRSPNGVDFSVIGIVQVEGNNSSQRFYSYVDSQPLEGDSYYRLRQTDYRGWCELYDIVPLSTATETQTVAQLNSKDRESRQ